jgi:hypothetical protein
MKSKKKFSNKTLKHCYKESWNRLLILFLLGLGVYVGISYSTDFVKNNFNFCLLGIPIITFVLSGLYTQYVLRNQSISLVGSPVSVINQTRSMYFKMGTYVKVRMFNIPSEWKVYITGIWLFLASLQIGMVLAMIFEFFVIEEAPKNLLFGLITPVVFFCLVPMLFLYCTSINIGIVVLSKRYEGCFVSYEKDTYFWLPEPLASQIQNQSQTHVF